MVATVRAGSRVLRSVFVLMAASATGCAADASLGPTGEVMDESMMEVAYPGETGTTGVAELTVAGYSGSYDYVEHNGERYFEGDIALDAPTTDDGEPDDTSIETPADIANPPPTETDATTEDYGSTAEALAARSSAALWPGGVVHYTISSRLTDRDRVWNAIRHWHRNTPIRFRRRNGQAAYVHIRPGSGCSANIGRTGGRQFVTIERACSTGNTIHELGHTIGLWHEQSRTDRGNHIRILWANISAGHEFNFKTYRQQGLDGRNIGRYDTNSMMHYGSTYFSRNGRRTLERLDGTAIAGQRRSLSARDIAGVRAIYAQ